MSQITCSQVIRGWDDGVIQMSVGEKAKLNITSDYAYGERVRTGRVGYYGRHDGFITRRNHLCAGCWWRDPAQREPRLRGRVARDLRLKLFVQSSTEVLDWSRRSSSSRRLGASAFNSQGGCAEGHRSRPLLKAMGSGASGARQTKAARCAA